MDSNLGLVSLLFAQQGQNHSNALSLALLFPSAGGSALGAAPPEEKQDKGNSLRASEERPEGMHKSILKAE